MCESSSKLNNVKTINKLDYKLGHCPRCLSTNIKLFGNKVGCLNCNDWAWLEDAIHSSWNANA